MSNEGPVDCYCDDDTDDGFMVFCEKCKHWQHGECVNINQWTIQSHYVCPTCQGLEISCTCEGQCDYMKALIQCGKCHKYQHKRHAGFGIGKNPGSYHCKQCSTSYQPGRSIKLDPILDFFPSFSDMFVPPDVSELKTAIPPGKFLTKLKEFNIPISPVNMIAQIYCQFRDNIFRCHRFLAHFNPDKDPREYSGDCSTFIYYLCSVMNEICGISIPQVMQVIDHLITIDIYKRPLPLAVREPVKEGKSSKINLETSDRASHIIDEMEFPSVPGPSHNKLSIVSGKNGFPTVITKHDLKDGDLICNCHGYISTIEEVDSRSQVPQMNVYATGQSELVLCPGKNCSPTYLRIRRGFAHNCEIKVYKSGDDIRAGLFATKMSLMTSPSAEKTKRNKKVVISAGDELVLPFDITPVSVRSDSEWRAKRDEVKELDPKDFTPIRPSPCQTVDMETRHDAPIPRHGSETQGESMLTSLFSDCTFAHFSISSEPSGRREMDHPGTVTKWPLPGKKFFGLKKAKPTHEEIPFREYDREISSQVEEPPIIKKILRAASYWDTNNSNDWAEPADEDLL